MSRHRSAGGGHDPDEGQGAAVPAINRIEVEAGIVEVLAAVLDGAAGAVLTLDGVDRLAVSTPAAAFDTGFALAIEPIAKSLDADLAVLRLLRASIEPVSAG